MLNEIDLSRADLNLFVLFEAVLEERHVGRAAARLNLTASAVSHGLGRLRRMLNDPLFLKHPKGVAPTARALELAPAIGDILACARSVVGTAQRFDPATSQRRFTLGAPDGVSSVILTPLIAELARSAPGVDLSVRAMMPQTALADLDAREADIVVQPIDEAPPRFASTRLYDEVFVIAMRHGHPLANGLTLERYAAAAHLLVSLTGDPWGNVDEDLKARGLSRRVALTVPNFLSALTAVAETDLLAAVPRRLAEAYAPRLGVTLVEAPLPFGRSQIRAIAARSAMADAGVAWLLRTLEAACSDRTELSRG